MKKHTYRNRPHPSRMPLLASLLFFAFSLSVAAQPPMATKQQIGMFKNSTTCIVLEQGSVAYNVFIKDAVKEHWSVTDYEFIDHKTFEERRSDSRYSFLVLMKGVYKKDPMGVSYDFMSLVLGGYAAEVDDMPELGSLPISYTGDEEPDYGYAIPAMVQFLQRHVRVLENKRLCIKVAGLKHYNHFKKFRGKALLLNEEMMAPDAETLFKVRDVYPNYVEMLSSGEIRQELKEDPDYKLFLYHVGPGASTAAGKSFEMIFDAKGHLYYYNSRDVTNEKKDGFTRKDLRRIR